MIFADATRAIKIVLSVSITTNQLPVVGAWTETTTAGVITDSSAVHTVTNSTTAVVVVGSPASGKIRKLQGLSVQNADTAAATVSVYADDGSNTRVFLKVTLAVGDQLVISDDGRWKVLDSSGQKLITVGVHSRLSGLAVDGHTQYALLAGRLGGQTLIGSTVSGEKITLQSTSHATRGGVWLADDEPLVLDQISAPSTPSSGKVALYAKSDKVPYYKNDDGDESVMPVTNLNLHFPKYLNAATASLTTSTASSNTTYCTYIGDTLIAPTSASVVCRCTTALAGTAWAEMAIFKGNYVANNVTSLTLIGWTNVSGVCNTTGIKKVAITLTDTTPGSYWFAYGSNATTPFLLRGMTVDDIQSGSVQAFTGRPSTVALPVTTTLVSASGSTAPWCAVALA